MTTHEHQPNRMRGHVHPVVLLTVGLSFVLSLGAFTVDLVWLSETLSGLSQGNGFVDVVADLIQSAEQAVTSQPWR